MSNMFTAGDIAPHMYGNKRVTIVDRGTTISGTIRRADFSVWEQKNFFGDVTGHVPVLALTIGRHAVERIRLDHPVIIRDLDD